MAGLISLSSESLVQACLALDNEAAWAEFIRRFQPLIGRIIERMVRRQSPQAPPHLVDDLIQETYLKLCADDYQLLRHFEFRHPQAIFGFLKVVAASVVLDHFKSELARKRDAHRTEPLLDETLEWSMKSRGSHLSMEDHIALRQIDEIVVTHYCGDMLVRNRAIFWLHHRDGMTAQAIASVPWIDLNTKGVETALRRMKCLIQSEMRTNP